jgi:hypothetical protein
MGTSIEPDQKPTELDAGQMPWGYGENRITAVVRDPDSAYLYWEITDAGIASARARLGAASARGWCNLRIYDTTDRDFDGTNANDYFDLMVDRADREYYLMIRRPTSSMHAEIGIKTEEGYFQPIARSGRADFPRSGPSPNASLDWMTIESDYAPPCAAPYRSKFSGPEPPLPGRAGAGYVDAWRAGYAPTNAPPEAARETASWSVQRTLEVPAHVERWWRLDEWRAEWRSGLRFLAWEHHDRERVAVELLGEEPVHLVVEGGEMVAYGPWRVTIRDVATEDASSSRRVLSTWSMRWVRAMTPLIERWQQVVERRRAGAWEREARFFGASDQYGLALGGASELLAIGGSERMWIGASEWAAGGASEAWRRGERGGASEWRGASDRLAASRFLGASEGEGSPADEARYSTESAYERWGGRLEPGKEPKGKHEGGGG